MSDPPKTAARVVGFGGLRKQPAGGFMRLVGLVGAIVLLASGGCTSPPAPANRTGLSRIDHIVVIYAENRSFDHLYGLFPGAEGIANASASQYTQLDHDGKPLPRLPAVWTSDGKADSRF